jgi:hypothetical protein
MRLNGDALLGSAPCNHQSDVICVLAFTELLYGLDDRLEKGADRWLALRKHSLDKAGLAKLHVLGVHGFCDAVGVKDQGVARGKLNLRNKAFPFSE